MRALAAIVLMPLFAGNCFAQTDEFSTGRKLYALAEAGDEYCPEIKIRFGVRSAISETFGYLPPTDEAELLRLNEQKAYWFQVFRNVGIRALACELLVREYGPGAKVQLFAFR